MRQLLSGRRKSARSADDREHLLESDLRAQVHLGLLTLPHRVELERHKGLSSEFAEKYEAVLEQKVKFEKML